MPVGGRMPVGASVYLTAQQVAELSKIGGDVIVYERREIASPLQATLVYREVRITMDPDGSWGRNEDQES